MEHEDSSGVQLEVSLLQCDNQSLYAWFSHEKQNLQLYVKLLGCHKIIQLVVDVICSSP